MAAGPAVRTVARYADNIMVRARGHVEPARFAEDLPPLVSLIRKHGLDVLIDI